VHGDGDRLGAGKADQPDEALLGVLRRQGIHPIPLLLRASVANPFALRFRFREVVS
jgi:hypothetical protein